MSDEYRRGHPNAGVVIEADAITVVDALACPSQAAELLAAVADTGLGVRRLVVTSSHVEYVGGTSQFTMAGIYGSQQASDQLDLPPNREGYQRLLPELAAEYVELETKRVSHVVSEPAWLSTATVAVPTGGQLRENLVVQVPEANVVFAGALCCFGVTPLAFDGDPAAWADALGPLLDLGQTIVPGHGPVGTADDVIALQAYLWACVEADGDPSRIPTGPWDEWEGRHWDAVNVERAAMLAAGDDSPPPSMLSALGLG